MNRMVRLPSTQTVLDTAKKSARVVAANVTLKKVAQQRSSIVLATLAPQADHGDDPFAALLERLTGAEQDEVWLALAVLRAELPTVPQVRNLHRRLRLDGSAALRRALQPSVLSDPTLDGEASGIEVLQGGVTVDVFHTAQTHLATGIQRVVREMTRRWDRDHDITLVSWTHDRRALRPLSPVERATALFGERPVPPATGQRLLIPWQGTHILPELATEPDRNARMLALVEFSRCRTGMVGYDCVPITTSETVAEGMGGAFARALSVARQMDRVGALCEASAVEYQGWAGMLGALDVPGPQVRSVPLAVNDPVFDPAAVERMRTLTGVGSDPLILVIGSHEPRKNHGVILHAAERLWREGLTFGLAFIGGNAWNSGSFQQRVAELTAAGRAVQSFSGLADTDVWAAYQLATATVFPSFNEGYGLPVAESLSCGTPVITSNFGSMAEIARSGGALLVDPHDDDDVTDALRRVLTDPAELARLQQGTQNWPGRTWDEYASEMWDFLVEGPAD